MRTADDTAMWGAVAALWARMLGGAAAALRRIRPPGGDPELRRFLHRLRARLAARHPEVRWRGTLPSRSSIVLEVEGQETPVPIGSLFRHYEAFPGAIDQLAERLVTDIEAEGLDEVDDLLFSDVAADVLPQVRTRGWLRARSPRFGDAALVHREFGADLVVCYVVDDAWSMVFLCERHLRLWGRSEADVHHLALRNLRQLGGTIPLPQAGDEPVKVSTGDGYDAARVLLLDADRAEHKLIALPDRDVLWIADDAAVELARVAALTRTQAAHASHAVSDKLYRFEDGALREVVSEE